MPSFIILPILHFEKSLTRTRKDSCARSCQLFEYQQPKSPSFCCAFVASFASRGTRMTIAFAHPACPAAHRVDTALSRGCPKARACSLVSIFSRAVTLARHQFHGFVSFCRPRCSIISYMRLVLDDQIFESLVPAASVQRLGGFPPASEKEELFFLKSREKLISANSRLLYN